MTPTAKASDKAKVNHGAASDEPWTPLSIMNIPIVPGGRGGKTKVVFVAFYATRFRSNLLPLPPSSSAYAAVSFCLSKSVRYKEVEEGSVSGSRKRH